MKITANKIIWNADDWFKGLNEQYGIETANKPVGKSFNSVQAVNPYRVIGYIMPGYLPANLTNNSEVDAVVLKSVSFAGKSKEYGITSTTKLVEFTGATITTGGSDFTHTVTNASANVTSLHDIIVYSSKVSSAGGADIATPRVFYSWNSSTKLTWSVGMWANLGDAAFYDDFMKTRPATPLTATAGSYNNPHPMIVGDDDLLYIGDGPRLHAFDGQYASDDDGKFYDSVLTIPGTYFMKSFQKYKDFLVIFADENRTGSAYSSQVKAFFWDYLSLDPTYVMDIDDNLITESFIYKGKLGCFTSGRKYDLGLTNTGKIQFFTGTGFDPEVFFNDTLPCRGGVNIASNQIRWNSSGKLYTWGNNVGLPQTLNIINKGGGTTSGMLSDGSGTLLMSSGTTTSGGLQSLSANYDYSAYFQTTSAEPNFDTRKKGRVKRVKIVFGNTNIATGDKLTVKLYYDRGGSNTTIASNIQLVTTDTLTRQYEYDISGNPLPDFESLSLRCEWGEGTVHTSAPWISSVEVEYETINI